MINLTPPLYHKADLKFIEEQLGKISYDVRFRISRLYSCIILEILHDGVDDVALANRARKEANSWLRTMAEAYPLKKADRNASAK